ncbi:MAG: UbiX family flavin prenyltransferase [bacterium]|nr:UbiX family flavin prenyltransferase [bacterium]
MIPPTHFRRSNVTVAFGGRVYGWDAWTGERSLDVTPKESTVGKPIVVAVTGASGAAYARRRVACLVGPGRDVHLICSPHGRRLLADELGIAEPSAETLLGQPNARLVVQPYRDLGSPLSSGSVRTAGMIVCPASANTMSAIAAGLGDNLIARAASVTLKEGRRLIVVPREMPWSQINIQAALTISQAGGIICPACPGFYLKPTRVEQLVDFVVGRLLDLMDIEHELDTRWTGTGEAP